jgi:uncharacterized protein (TIGR03435 family)
VELIGAAYGVDPESVLGGPSWVEQNHFDVVAQLPGTASPQALRLMMQTLLRERFGLALSNETRLVPAYVLKLGAGNPNLRLTAANEAGGEGRCEDKTPATAGGNPPDLVESCRNMTMEGFAAQLRTVDYGFLDKPVVDQTGLKGRYDFELTWTGRNRPGKRGPEAISLFQAVDRELGLKLEPGSAPRPVLAIAKVNEVPTPNEAGIEKLLPARTPARFEVAVIKPSRPETQFSGRFAPAEVDVKGASLGLLMDIAYGRDWNDIDTIANAPKWLRTTKWDISAKVATEPGGKARELDPDDLREELKALLAERWDLVAHSEQRMVMGWTLLAGTPKLKAAVPESRTRCVEGPGPDGRDPRVSTPVLNQLLSCQNVSLAEIAKQLQMVGSGYIQGDVLDLTGLTGRWDFTLSFSSAEVLNSGAGASEGGLAEAGDPTGALSLFDAVSRQLGLKLEKQKRMGPVVVIDQVTEMPTAN